MDLAEVIWDRAALAGGGESPEIGDMALATALAFHGLAMSGGVLDAAERTSADLSRVEDAFRWLGLEPIAVLLESIGQSTVLGVPADDDRADACERDADERYAAILPSDAMLDAAFRARLAKDPGAFAGPAAASI